MKQLFEKWFCKHKWKTHEKVQKTLGRVEYNPRTGMHENNPNLTREITREILICDNCGKIKQIEY